MTAATYRIDPLPTAPLDNVRATGRDVSGFPVEHAAATGGEPLRCCLRDAAPGEALILFGYEPPLPASPYREIGAVFAHATPCTGPAGSLTYPPDWYGRPQVLRAYDHHGRIHPATRVTDGTDPEAAIRAVLADPDVARIHSRNVAYGCYMFTVIRAE
ncbi:DUF1203 domain-containing protein [Actinoplanes sp. GCM10030250]|uniref:DUF1203 domain-containing protein n=1 Tax=Actinoplanes sp. GCM10030250 TaxID=3273376 RepID=UPI0036221EED